MESIGRGDRFRLSSGKEFYAYAGRLSLDEKGFLCYGYDGDVSEASEFTIEERIEIADAMIVRWESWKKPYISEVMKGFSG